MFHYRQIHAFLVESISNYVFKEEKKIVLDSNKIEAITEVIKSLKNTYEEVPFLAKLRLEVYNFTKNELP